jgi:Regulator of chromosome condensation (RCC1) repeat/IPT/TIG domain
MPYTRRRLTSHDVTGLSDGEGAGLRSERQIDGSRGWNAVAGLAAAVVAFVLALAGLGAASAGASTVTAWGLNAEGQLGIGNTTGPSKCTFNKAELACSLSALPVTALESSEATAVAAGKGHSLALLANGTVMAWGANGSGQLGNGTTTNASEPVAVSGLTEVTAIAAGDGFSLALKSNGTVMAWGTNEAGQLGNGTTTGSTTPVAVSGITEAKAIAAGFAHSLALLGSGTVKSWGANQFGQLGNGTDTGPSKCKPKGIEVACAKTPVAVGGLSEASSVAAGELHSLAGKKNGTAVAWGIDEEGQLGNGATEESTVPVDVLGLTEVATVAAGGSTSMALMTGGTVMAWGSNVYGQLGDNLTTESARPIQVCGLGGVSSISTRGGHSLAVGSASPQCPSVTGVSPAAGVVKGGTAVTITGTNLTGAAAVKFGATAATEFKVESPTTIAAVSPAGAGTVDVTVTTPVGTSAKSGADRFSYESPPQITAVAPNTGPGAGGTHVTITGSSFIEASEVDFGATPATSFKVESPTSISAVAPAGSGAVDIHVTTPFGTSTVSKSDVYAYLLAPEFGRCIKVATGQGAYGSANCTIPGGTKTYEWYPAFGGSKPLTKVHFTSKNTGTAEPKLAAVGEPITCKTQTGAGELTSGHSVSLTLTFTACHRGALGNCTSAGANEGEVKSQPLTGTLGVVTAGTEAAKNKLGLDLQATSGEAVAEFSCAGVSTVWTGSVIVEVKANAMLGALAVKYLGSKGLQKPSHFEGQPEDVPLVSLAGEPPVKAVLTLTTAYTFEEKIEINSVV